MIDFRTEPTRYRHWRLELEPPLARLIMAVDETGGLFEGYELKKNSYDLGVDIELYDAMLRLRFEHPEVHCVVLTSGLDGIFSAGANIRMLGRAAHSHKVNFCKFTNETRNAIEEAGECSGQHYLCAINGTAAGGGYELALAAEYLMLIDDGNAAVGLPEVPLLAVLPGTGGLTRLVDKRKVRRDLADFFCTVEEGVRGERAVQWRLVDEVVPSSRFAARVAEKAVELAGRSDRPAQGEGVVLTPLEKTVTEAGLEYPHVTVELDRGLGTATIRLQGPSAPPPADPGAALGQGAEFWPLALTRALDDALLHLRFNERAVGTLIFEAEGDIDAVAAYDDFVTEHRGHWFLREVLHYWKRTAKRLDLTSRTTFAFIGQGSCFAGLLAEVLFAVDRSYMLEGRLPDDERPPAVIRLGASNFGLYPMANGLSRLATRFLGEPQTLEAAEALAGRDLDAAAALAAGLITFALDDIDWEDELRILLEERASFSPDSLTGMEANLRFAGPETMETKIFGRLSAWQNWIFQRPNAVSDKGALRLYGSGQRPDYDQERV